MNVFILIAAATSVRLVIPAFAAQGVPGILSNRLPQEYARAIGAAHCAGPTGVGQIGPQTAQAIDECEGDRMCIARIARLVGFNLILLGWVSKLDEHYIVALKLVNAEDGSVRKSFDMVHSGPLKSIPDTVTAFTPTICKTIDPAWVDTSKSDAEQSLAAMDFDTGAAAAPPAAAFAPSSVVAPPSAEPLASPPVRPRSAEPPSVELAPIAVVPAAAAQRIAAAAPAPMAQTQAAPPVLPPAIEARPHPVAAQPLAARPAALLPPHLVVTPPAAQPSAPSVKQPAPRSWWAGPQSSRSRTAVYAAITTTGLAAAIGGGFAASTLDALSKRSSAKTETEFDQAQSDLQTRGTTANAAFGVAGVALVGSIVLWFVGDAIFHDAG